VDSKINELLGINKNQFRQIVMLPQGEFRKLLEAESKEREVIFRKIFGTEAFQTMQQRLDNLQKEFYKKIKEAETKRAAHVKHIQPGEDELLARLINAEDLNIQEIVQRTKELISVDEKECEAVNRETEAVKASQEKLQREIVEGQENNNKLKDRENQLNLYNSLLLKEDQYGAKKVSLEKARRAVQVKLIENALSDRKNSLEAKENQCKQAELSLLRAEENTKVCEEKLKLEDAREPERKRLAEEITSLKEKEQKVKSYEVRLLSIEDKKKELSNKKSSLDQYKTSLNADKAKLHKAKENFDYIGLCERDKLKLSKTIDDYKILMDRLRELREKIRQYQSNVKEHFENSQNYLEFERKYLQCKADYEEMEGRFLKEQAGILANGLQEGIECPVCGSTHHPKPAIIVDNAPSEEDVKKAKKLYDDEREERDRRLLVLAELNGKITTSFEDLSTTKGNLKSLLGEEVVIKTDEEILLYINERGPKLKDQVEELRTNISKFDEIISKKEATADYIDKLQKSIDDKEKVIPKLEEEYTQYYGKVSAEEEQLKIVEAEIPEQFRSYSKLSAKVKQLESMFNLLVTALKDAQTKFNEAKNQQASIIADKAAKHASLKEAEEEVKLWSSKLNDKIVESSFKDYDEYIQFKMTDKEIEALEKEINDYYKMLQSSQDALEKLNRSTEGFMLINIDELTKALDEIKMLENKLVDKNKILFSRIKNNKDTLEEIRKINAAISGDEAQYGIISDISRAANGFNEERITFERYVLAAYFDEIISAANLRLSKMAAGRFVLKRKEEKGKGLRQEGLELEVFDNYTGRSRHVKTLSGGESFKASLALALGLADVVQSYAGGISLDTMFVDEGFGTLDPESLDHAIQCLIDLQKSGRLVGIISHVPELKERIDARLEITPAKEGSKARFIV
jgi:exonuclease SbcC